MLKYLTKRDMIVYVFIQFKTVETYVKMKPFGNSNGQRGKKSSRIKGWLQMKISFLKNKMLVITMMWWLSFSRMICNNMTL